MAWSGIRRIGFPQVLPDLAKVFERESYPADLPKHHSAYWKILESVGGDRLAMRALVGADYPPPSPDEAAAIDVPTLVISGERDQVLGRGPRLAAALGRAEYLEIASANHFALAMDPTVRAARRALPARRPGAGTTGVSMIQHLRLHHYPASRSARAKWALHEVVGDGFEVKRVPLYDGAQYDDAYLQLNPNHAVPLLEITWSDGREQRLFESAAIVEFLADAYPDKGLAPPPGASPARADYLQMLHFGSTWIDMMLWQVRVHEDVLPEAARDPRTVARYRHKFTTEVEPQLARRLGGHALHLRRGVHGGRLHHRPRRGLGAGLRALPGRAVPAVPVAGLEAAGVRAGVRRRAGVLARGAAGQAAGVAIHGLSVRSRTSASAAPALYSGPFPNQQGPAMCDNDSLDDMVEHLGRNDALSRRRFGALSAGLGLVAMLPRAANAAEVTEQEVEIKTSDGTADAYFVHPAKGKYPGRDRLAGHLRPATRVPADGAPARRIRLLRCWCRTRSTASSARRPRRRARTCRTRRRATC